MLRHFTLICLLIVPLLLVANSSYAFEEEEVKKEQKSESDNTEKDKKETPTTGSPKKKQRSDITIIAPIVTFSQQKEDLNHYLPKNIIKPILAGPDDYTTLVETSTTPNNKGVIILLPEWQQNAVNPKAINFLRKALPDKGWTTISVQAPNMPANYPSHALKLSERTEENIKILTPYKEKLQTLMTAVMKQAKNYPGIFLVITQGSHAAILIDIYEEKPDIKPTALVMLSSFMLTDIANERFAKNIALSELPVLDLYLKKDHPLVKSSAQLRKKYTNKEMKTSFRQKQLQNFNSGYYPKETLLREINGWLKTIGW
ncbi:MAG: hypothetical protein ACI9LM_003606 [Alteromonadaceae bacterium]|jgi:hypothetical protein